MSNLCERVANMVQEHCKPPVKHVFSATSPRVIIKLVFRHKGTKEKIVKNTCFTGGLLLIFVIFQILETNLYLYFPLSHITSMAIFCPSAEFHEYAFIQLLSSVSIS